MEHAIFWLRFAKAECQGGGGQDIFISMAVGTIERCGTGIFTNVEVIWCNIRHSGDLVIDMAM